MNGTTKIMAIIAWIAALCPSQVGTALGQQSLRSDSRVQLRALCELVPSDHSFSLSPQIAISVCTNALADTDNWPRELLSKIYLRRGIAYGVVGDFRAASWDLLCAIRVDPANQNVKGLYGGYLMLQGKTQESINAMDRLHREDPENEVPYVVLAGLSLQRGMGGDCITLCDRALRVAKSVEYKSLAYYLRAQAFYSLQQLDKCLDDIDIALRLMPLCGAPVPEQPYILKGKVLLRLKRYDEALAAGFMAKRLAPSDLGSLGLVFQAYCALEKFNVGALYSSEMLDVFPNDMRSFVANAITSNRLGNYARGLEMANRALNQDGRNLHGLTEGGIAKEGLADEDGAMLYYRRAIAVDSTDVTSQRLLARFLSTSPSAVHRNGQEAFKYASQACWLTNNGDSECLRALASSYAEIGQFNEAVLTMEKCIDLLPAWSKRRSECNNELQQYRAKKPFRRPGVAAGPAATKSLLRIELPAGSFRSSRNRGVS